MISTLINILSISAYIPAQGGMGMSGTSMVGIALLGITALISFGVQRTMMAKMEQYSHTAAPMTGAQAAQRMLDENGIRNVSIISTEGQLTDHYDPTNRTVNLSESVYNINSVAAMAVAAHECGHALQHAQGYAWLQMRSSLVPLVGIGSKLGQVVLTIGLILAAMGSGTSIAWIGLGLFATTTLFALVTLPVEFDASRRALAWLQNSGHINASMYTESRSALSWAAMTYVSAALSSIAMLLYYALILLNRSGGSNRE